MQIHIIYSWFVSKLSSNGVIDTEFCIFSLYGRCAFPFLSPDSMTQHVHPLSEHRLLNQLWRHQERNKCNTATMPALWDVRGNTDSTCSFSRQLFTWEKQGKISQFNHGDAMHLSKNIFYKIYLPPTTPFPSRVRVSMRLIWQKTLNANQLWHLFCVLLQFRGVSSEKAPMSNCVKNLPFPSSFRLLHSNEKGISQLGAQNAGKAQEAPTTRGTGMPKTSREQNQCQLLGDKCSPGKRNFCTASSTCGATENWMWERKSGRKKSPHSRAQAGNLPFSAFIWICLILQSSPYFKSHSFLRKPISGITSPAVADSFLILRKQSWHLQFKAMAISGSCQNFQKCHLVKYASYSETQIKKLYSFWGS